MKYLEEILNLFSDTKQADEIYYLQETLRTLKTLQDQLVKDFDVLEKKTNKVLGTDVNLTTIGFKYSNFYKNCVTQLGKCKSIFENRTELEKNPSELKNEPKVKVSLLSTELISNLPKILLNLKEKNLALFIESLCEFQNRICAITLAIAIDFISVLNPAIHFKKSINFRLKKCCLCHSIDLFNQLFSEKFIENAIKDENKSANNGISKILCSMWNLVDNSFDVVTEVSKILSKNK